MSKPLATGIIMAVVGLCALGGFVLWQAQQQEGGQDVRVSSSPPTPSPQSDPVERVGESGLFLAPARGSFVVGETFMVDVLLDTQDLDVVAAGAYIAYPENLVQPLSIDTTDSPMLFVFEKTFELGKIGISGGTPRPGFNGFYKIATVEFQTVDTGIAEISFLQDSGVFTGVEGENIFEGGGSTRYEINPGASQIPRISVEQHGRCEYGELPEEFYLSTYVVKSGDTLLSIANRKLGSTARIEEIINLNKHRGAPYDSLVTSDVINTGWKLYLPTEFLPPNSGNLVGKKARLKIATSGSVAGQLVMEIQPGLIPVPANFSENAKFFETKQFGDGDCAMIITDLGDLTGGFTNIAIAPQSNAYAFQRPGAVYGKNEVELATASQCVFASLGAEDVLRSYIVKQGDTLYAIAKERLGNAARLRVIREINAKRYQSLRNSDFIEIGWELLLPPFWINTFSDFYGVQIGVIVEKDGRAFRLANDVSSHRDYSVRFFVISDTKYFGGDDFSVGECVAVFHGYGGEVLGIAPQDTDYIGYFQYGSDGGIEKEKR